MSNPHSVEKAIQKFQQLAKDAQSSGDLVLVENYLQHADHYSRRLAELNEKIGSNNNERKPLNTDIQNDSSSLKVNEEKQTSS